MFHQTLSDLRDESLELSQELIQPSAESDTPEPHKRVILYGVALAPVAATLLVTAVSLLNGPIIDYGCQGRGQCTF